MSCMKQVIEILDLLEDPKVNGEILRKLFLKHGADDVEVTTLKGEKGKTDFIKILIQGRDGKSKGGKSPTLGIIGRLGGIGVRPNYVGIVSDADGAIISLSAALKIAIMKKRGDVLDGDVVITTHISPSSPIIPHKPVPFVTSPVDMMDILRHEVTSDMDAILSVDATKGNRIIKVYGFAITPTVKNGWILKVSDDLTDIYERVVGDTVSVVPITMQDITPHIDRVYHINSIMFPWLMTDAPVVGVATTAKIPIAGCSTGSNYIYSLEQATRFCVEVAKEFTSGRCKFYDEDEYLELIKLYGDMSSIFREIEG